MLEKFINSRYLISTMKLQKHLSRKIGDKKYTKWVITIPADEIEKLGWKEGEDLELVPKGKKAEIKPKK